MIRILLDGGEIKKHHWCFVTVWRVCDDETRYRRRVS